MKPAFVESLRGSLRGRVLANESLARHTTWRVGGAADLFIVPADSADLVRALEILHREGIRWLPLGAGSNLLVRDGGIRGAVIHTGRLRQMVFEADDEVRAEGGLPLMALIRETARRGLAGLEALAGIPGTLGGAVAMNAGAGGQDLAAVVSSVTLAGAQGEEEWPAAQLSFAYRTSALPADRVVTAARLRFRAEAPEKLAEAMAERLAHRRRAQNVGRPNAGSVFRNPPGRAAWRLIDEAGLRGMTVGAAQVAPQHANFIVNAGGASAADILELIERIRETVRQRSGVDLEPEVRIVGDE